ncbi:MAG: bifunctional DNA-formamidopyrimidine glycosylase/DNA-(apurinic or apyrimidinic site) lyase [Planctomycetes bacterium]|nr:bifunctional DNA-formamidopyrimidine glycosylase/DNA-(apurinic or apyrimidinic site) lyase [Planctomycetota bacterium]
MPELPEVETMVRGIRPHVEGRTIASVRRCRCRLKPIAIHPSGARLGRLLRGSVVNRVRRIAKRVVLEMGSGAALAIEPRMTGLVLLGEPPNREHLRLEWRFADAGEYPSLWFWDRRGLGTVRLYLPGEIERHLGPERLGRDALEMTRGEWAAKLSSTRRAVKVALLDQRLAAGIGNLYASEILHLTRIHPERPADALRPSEVTRLHAAVQAVLSDAIRYEGSTLGDGTYRNALSREGRYQNEHRVYMRCGSRCPTCRRGTIVRIVQAQRSTFFCPRCQRL